MQVLVRQPEPLAHDLVATVAHLLWVYYTGGEGAKMPRPRARIEDDTTGQLVLQPGQRSRLRHESLDTTEDSRYMGVVASEGAVEEGFLEGPKELAEECDELHRDEHGRWIGRKDVLMAYGFCATVIDASAKPIGPPVDTRHERRIDAQAMIARYQRQERIKQRGY
jgi:hypothetical protein